MVDLVDEGYDAAIRITNLASSKLVSRRLATTRIVCCASPGYLATHGAPVHPHELADHRAISYTYRTGGDVRRTAGPAGEIAVRVRPRIHNNSGDTILVAGRESQGVILPPDSPVGMDLEPKGRVIGMRTSG